MLGICTCRKEDAPISCCMHSASMSAVVDKQSGRMRSVNSCQYLDYSSHFAAKSAYRDLELPSLSSPKTFASSPSEDRQEFQKAHSSAGPSPSSRSARTPGSVPFCDVPEELLKSLERASDNQQTSRAWARIGQFHQRQKNFGKARSAYQKAVAVDSSQHGCLANLAQLEAHAGNVDTAKEMLTAALQLDPSNKNYLSFRRWSTRLTILAQLQQAAIWPALLNFASRISMLAEAWAWLIHRLRPQDEALNTAEDQEFLNRLNTGGFRPVPVAGTGTSSQIPATQGNTASAAASGEVAAETLSAEELRERRVAHLDRAPQ
eukprot:s308_g8.t1